MSKLEGHGCTCGESKQPVDTEEDGSLAVAAGSETDTKPEVSTLKRRNLASSKDEDRILLRQTNVGTSTTTTTTTTSNNNNDNNKLSASKANQKQRKISSASQVLRDEDSNSVTTTTSDVDSDDDATSIVSRLSQIVVEQEGKLMTSGDVSGPDSRKSPINNNNKQPTSGVGFSYSKDSKETHSSGSNQEPCYRKDGRKLTTLKSPISSVAESTNLNQSVQDGTRFGHQFSPSSPTSDRLPEIYVIADEENLTSSRANNSNKSDRSRAKSVIERRFNEPNNQQLQRIESTGHLPERGDLRSLENSRRSQYSCSLNREQSPGGHQHIMRHRSNTNDSMLDQSPPSPTGAAGGLLDSGGQLMLNIRRSAWTLNEFDQTFNKSSDKSETSSINDFFPGADISDSSTSGLINSSVGSPIVSTNAANSNNINMGPPSQAVVAAAAAKLGSGMQEKQTNNLLIRASKNAISLNQQHQTPISVNVVGSTLDIASRYNINNSPTGMCNLDIDRRHSAVSFSSLDSFCNNKVITRGLRSFKKRRSNGGQGGEGDDGEERGCFRSCCNLETFGHYLPILQWLPSYSRRFFWGDLMAGLAVAVLNISTSLSAAVVAETDLGAAFRASIVNTFVYAILCSSKHTSFGSWSIMSQMLVVSVRRALSDELLLNRLNIGPSASWNAAEYERWHLNIIIMYTFLIGLTQLIGGLLNLGNILASFIPEALCSSMIAATAFTMAVGQVANMCGTSNKILWSIERNTTALWADLKNPPVDITDLFAGLFRWVQQIALLIKYYEQINLVCVAISVGSVIVLFLNQCVIQKQLEKQFKRKIFIPFEMILLIVMITLSYSLGLKENYNVATCGPIDIDFEIPTLPNLKLIRELWFESLATALISYSMVYIMAKTYSNKLNYEVDCNQELIACGAGNLVGGLFDALPATASFSRTAGQVEAGGQTQMASLINCVVLVILAKLLGHHVSALPICVMSATLFFGFVRMMTRFMEVFNYWRVCKVDFAIWLVTFMAILTLDLVNGFVYGFIFSILTMLYRAQNRRCYMLGCIGSSDVYVPLVKYPLAQEIEGIKIFQFCGPIHYVCADLFERLLRRKTRVDVKRIAKHIAEQEIVKFNPRDMNLPSHIILDFSMISFIDSAGINVIRKIIEDYKSVNVTVLLASLASHVATVIKSEPSLWETYKERFYITLSDAVHCAIRDSRLQQTGVAIETIVTE